MQTRSEQTDAAAGAGTAWFGERLAGLSRGIVGGSATVVERSVEGGLMPPLHTRDAVVAPRGVERTFRVESERARWLVLTAVDSHERYVDFLRALAPPAEG